MIKKKIYNLKAVIEKFGDSGIDKLVSSFAGDTTEAILKNESLDVKNIKIDGLKKVCDFIFKNKNKKFAIIGDYDVDGITSSSILYKGLKFLGIECFVLLPDRFENGYGLSTALVNKAIELKADIIITCDNGINAIEGLDYAKEKGLEVIITDHHLPNDKSYQKYDLVINPHTNKNNLNNKNICGAFVAFILIYNLGINNDNLLLELRELASIGTIADCMSLNTHNCENRYLIASMYKHWKKGIVFNKGLSVLINTLAKFKKEEMSYENIAFYLAPALNASGRLSSPDISFKILNEENPLEIAKASSLLNNLNARRQMLVAEALEKISISKGDKVQVLSIDELDCSEREKEGIIGLISAKVVEITKTPVLVFAGNKFSGRTTIDVDLHKLISTTTRTVKSLSFGGHKEACGGRVALEDMAKFKKALNKNIDKVYTEETIPYISMPDDVNLDLLVNTLEKYEPTNNIPLFIKRDFVGWYPSILGLKHFKSCIKIDNTWVSILKFNDNKVLEFNEGDKTFYVKEIIFKIKKDFGNKFSFVCDEYIAEPSK